VGVGQGQPAVTESCSAAAMAASKVSRIDG
jgi:hypothetical protein